MSNHPDPCVSGRPPARLRVAKVPPCTHPFRRNLSGTGHAYVAYATKQSHTKRNTDTQQNRARIVHDYNSEQYLAIYSGVRDCAHTLARPALAGGRPGRGTIQYLYWRACWVRGLLIESSEWGASISTDCILFLSQHSQLLVLFCKLTRASLPQLLYSAHLHPQRAARLRAR